MNARVFTLVVSLFTVFLINGNLYAAESSSFEASLTVDERWDIKRQVMSTSGVMLDMANMTDRGYAWKNDVIWEGADLPTNEKWYIAGFFFERTGYKGVWLQYAVKLDEVTRTLSDFKRWYGSGSFR